MTAAASITEPLFDSSAKALRFALNYHLAPQRPQLNKMMAAGKIRRLVLADGSVIVVAAPSGRLRSDQLRGLDGAAQAGMILQVLSRLPDPQQLVLMAESMTPALPCSCRSPCCSGSRPNPEWTRSVLKLREYLKEEAQLSRVKGKRGMSTHPRLRRQLVEKFFVPGRRMVLAELAAECEVAEATVIAHRRPILTFLEAQQSLAWREVDAQLSESGIVGFLA